MKSIKIENLKNVDALEFLVPEPGVWLLTGENGCGKTTLLACLRRIGFRNAFPLHFPTSSLSERLDEYSRSKITYSIESDSVTYSYANERWVPKPKRNADLLSKFGFSDTIYIGATADRITPKPEDFNISNVRAAPSDIKDATNYILGTTKFSNLRKVNVTRGVNPAFVFSDGAGNYYSEKNFSLGELCILKLLERIKAANPNSLILIDELEMALHPSAQVRLFNYLREKADEHAHTVIFSTHSVSLIKSAERASILYLRREGSKTTVEKKPFPSVVLGGLAYVEEKSADIVVYVEDEMAEFAAEPLLQLVSAEKIKGGRHLRPRFEVVPIGGYEQVIHFLKRHEALHRPSIKSFALLDKDVETEVVSNWRATSNHTRLAWLEEYSGRILYLPWTPEVGIVDLYRSTPLDLLERMRIALNESQLQFSAAPSLADQGNRKHAKESLKNLPVSA